MADKLLNRAKGMPNLEPPEDKSITTLYIGGKKIARSIHAKKRQITVFNIKKKHSTGDENEFGSVTNY